VTHDGIHTCGESRRLPDGRHPRRRGGCRSASPDPDAAGWRDVENRAGARSIDRGAAAERITHLNRALAIIGELRASLDPAGGAIAGNLDNLYEFMSRQVLLAHVDPRVEILDGVSSLLSEIRSAWILIPQDARTRPAEIR